MDLVFPPHPGPVPVVVWVHGGMWQFGSRLEGPGTGSAARALVERGIAVAQVEYRFSGEIVFPGCLHDVKAAVRWLRRFGPRLGINGEAIGVWGESSGGHLAALVAMNGVAMDGTDEQLDGTAGVTDGPSTVTAAVAWCPVTDILALGPDGAGSDDPRSPEALLIGGPTRQHRQAAVFASPTTHVSGDAAPLLLVHGLEDAMVPPRQSVLLHEALMRVGAVSELDLVDDAGHVLFGVDIDPIADRSADFLGRHLG
jgi:acetyl esterase/lipase